jgi:hypothetical protein
MESSANSDGTTWWWTSIRHLFALWLIAKPRYATRFLLPVNLVDAERFCQHEADILRSH